MEAKLTKDFNVFLKNELTASQAYQKVLQKMAKDGPHGILEECLDSHKNRVDKLKNAIIKLGGQPAAEIGITGKIAELILEGVGSLSDRAMITALAEDEGGWTSEYEWRLVQMHDEYRSLIKDDLLPEQQETEEKMRELENSMNKGLWPATPGTKDI